MTDRPVVIAPEAADDLRELYDWITDRGASPHTAIGYIERLEAFCLSLGSALVRGHRRDDIRPGLRVVGFERRVTVAFQVTEARVTILRVFYGGRNWESTLEM